VRFHDAHHGGGAARRAHGALGRAAGACEVAERTAALLLQPRVRAEGAERRDERVGAARCQHQPAQRGPRAAD
jgi:hypothetical protein